ncbi:hypothetical protein [Paenibacillus sp. YAF4_2]|uniref:hypothetical protein n=1 Tax=Paenibacillus sp. YAF4_2 TaxID=3233085 RepID=UPI003F9C890D
MNYKTKILLIVVLLFDIIGLGWFAHLYLSREYSFWHTKNTDLSIAKPYGYYLGESLDDVAFKGKPMTNLNNAKYDYFQVDQGIVAASNKEHKLIRIVLNSDGMEVAKGIKVGSPLSDAMEVFGGSYYKRGEEQMSDPVIGYVDRKKDMTIEFWSKNGLITEIRIDRSFVQ